MKKIMRITMALLICLILFGSVRESWAYFTHQEAEIDNPLPVGNVDITVKENFEKPEGLKIGDNSYRKEVSFVNEGSASAFVRASLNFSDTNVAEISALSSDGGKNFYSVSEFDEHLPEDWVKGSGDLAGYYYYTKALDPGEETPALITHVKTSFIEKTAETNTTINYTPRDYDIYIYAEGLQKKSLDGSGYAGSWQEAWAVFLSKKE